MINPAGSTVSTERLINNSFERGIALQASEYLQSHIERECPHTRVLLTRSPGQATGALHNAHCANSLGIDLFISLHFYHEQSIKPHIYLYQFSYNNQIRSQPCDFSFYKYHQSYFFNHASSAQAAHILTDLWSRAPYINQFTTHAVIGFPCTPLIGIIAPALALDIGIKEPADWQTYMPALINGIKELVQHCS